MERSAAATDRFKTSVMNAALGTEGFERIASTFQGTLDAVSTSLNAGSGDVSRLAGAISTQIPRAVGSAILAFSAMVKAVDFVRVSMSRLYNQSSMDRTTDVIQGELDAALAQQAELNRRAEEGSTGQQAALRGMASTYRAALTPQRLMLEYAREHSELVDNMAAGAGEFAASTDIGRRLGAQIGDAGEEARAALDNQILVLRGEYEAAAARAVGRESNALTDLLDRAGESLRAGSTAPAAPTDATDDSSSGGGESPAERRIREAEAQGARLQELYAQSYAMVQEETAQYNANMAQLDMERLAAMQKDWDEELRQFVEHNTLMEEAQALSLAKMKEQAALAEQDRTATVEKYTSMASQQAQLMGEAMGNMFTAKDADSQKKALQQWGADILSQLGQVAIAELGVFAAKAFGTPRYVAGGLALAAIPAVAGLVRGVGGAVSGGGAKAKPVNARPTQTDQGPRNSTTNVINNTFGVVGDPRGAARMIGEQVRTGSQYGLSPAGR
jgi:hypothetical protein